jgi:O-antigen/teichoic acid export membrane protein
MFAEKTESRVPADAAHHRPTFFRQSGWLMVTNVGGGLLMFAVHFLNKLIPEVEYGDFGAMIAVVIFLPTIPLQMVFAQQTAKALALNREGELAGMIRLVWLGTFGLWLAAALAALGWQGKILAHWQIASPMALWLTLPILLFSLWLPMFSGVLQGQQNFLWLGWMNVLGAVFRLGIAGLLVFLVARNAASMMAGVLLGTAAVVAVGIWQTGRLWSLPAQPFDWRSLLAQVIPLTLGFAAVQFFFTADTLFVKAYFSREDAAFYVSAGTLSRALMWLVIPLATVMFPKIVHSTVKSEKADLTGMVMIGTAILAASGALGLWLVGPCVVKLVFKPSYVQVASSVLPWYAWAMVPLSLANVLIYDLLARASYRVVPALVILAAVYGTALTHFHDSLVMVLQTLGVSNLLLLGVCAWFTWGKIGVRK